MKSLDYIYGFAALVYVVLAVILGAKGSIIGIIGGLLAIQVALLIVMAYTLERIRRLLISNPRRIRELFQGLTVTKVSPTKE